MPPSSDFKSQRVLATVVLTDVVGFSSLMSVNEEETLALVDADLNFIAVLCEQHQGRIVKSTGDGLLMYFTSAVAAVEFSVTVQQHMENYRGDVVSQMSLSHRIGIHTGEVFLRDNDIMGHAVNIAARLEGLARVGGICLSQAVYDIVKNTISVEAECLGFQQLKNIRDPILVYRLLGDSETDAVAQNFSSHQESDLVEKGKKLNKKQHRLFTREDEQDRQVLLSKVRNFWLKGVLENSLHNKVALELGLEEYADAVIQPWGLAWEYTHSECHSIKPGVPAIELFDQLGTGATLLLLGHPGSGKTTTLLQMTRDLVVRAEVDPSYKIPVVLNLSSWNRQPLETWIVQDLSSKYQIPRQIGKKWVESQSLILMLDGLDEVIDRYREESVEAINRFSETYRYTEIVVCSRRKDYESLNNRLQFQGAIFIQPLTDEQVQEYFRQGGEELSVIRSVVLQNEKFRELTRSPLMLSLMTLAYQGLSSSELEKLALIENPIQPLLEFYTERMLDRQSQHQPYSRKQTKKWLKWLALNMFLNGQSLFTLEGMQPTVFKHWLQLWTYRLGVGLAVGTIYGFIFGFAYRLVIALPITAPIARPINLPYFFILENLWLTIFLGIYENYHLSLLLSPILGIIIGVLGTFFYAWNGRFDTIYPIEVLQISWRKLIILITSGLVTGVFAWKFVYDFGLGFILSLFTSLIFTFAWKNASSKSKTIPNEGIWGSVSIASSIILVLDFSVFFGIFTFIYPHFSISPFPTSVLNGPSDFILGLGLGFSIGLIFVLRSKTVRAGIAVIQHIMLRTITWLNGYTPRNYARFLRYATRCAFVQPVGSSYIFIHRFLLEHFALTD